MSQIPIESVMDIESIGKFTKVCFPSMSEQSAKKFCKQQGWYFSKEGRAFVGRCVKGNIMLHSNPDRVALFSR